jgi:hypothetical protein
MSEGDFRSATLHLLTAQSTAEAAQHLDAIDRDENAATLIIADGPVAQHLKSSASPLVDRLGAQVASTADELAGWLSARRSLAHFFVLPQGAPQAAAFSPRPEPRGDFVAVCCPPVELPAIGNLVTPPQPFAWRCSRGVIADLVAHVALADWSVPSLVRALQQSRRAVAWCSTPLADAPREPDEAPPRAPAISTDGRVLAVIPHFECDAWLRLALSSITTQTRRPDAVVVVDDASSTSPEAIVAEFGDVTLLRSDRRCGPYALVQRVMDATDFDAYLLQDADDISAVDRLERLLVEGERSGAGLIGTQAVELHWGEPRCNLFCFPRRIAKGARQSDYSLLHPSSLVSKRLVDALGGFSSGLVFGGDAEFLHRARFTDAVIGNLTDAGYFKMVHARALTRRDDTGFTSPARRALRQDLQRRFDDLLAAADAGARPDLAPFKTAAPPTLTKICGPSLGPF